MGLSNVSIQAKIQHQILLIVIEIKKCILLFIGHDCHVPFPHVNTLFFSVHYYWDWSVCYAGN